MESNTYIHFGAPHFIPDLVQPIKNLAFFSKPAGGLWASPVDAEFGWIDWMNENDYLGRESITKSFFQFKLKPETRLLTITDVSQLANLPHRGDEDCFIEDKLFSAWQLLDFEELAKSYDAIEVILSADWRLYHELYGWDCDSILIMNKDIIEII